MRTKAIRGDVTATRRVYTRPVLRVRGDIEDLTLSCTDKQSGATDGLTLLSQDITFNCS